MKELYNQYPMLKINERIPKEHCVVCYRRDNECECEDVDVMEKLEELDKEIKLILKRQNR